MVITELNNTAQIPDIPGISAGIEFLKHCPADLPDGRIEIDGRNVYAIVQTYNTKEIPASPRFEAHRKYIDIQFLLSGYEILGWAPFQALKITEPYDAAKDIMFGTVADALSAFISFHAGQALILYPEDAHAPGLAVKDPAPVRKVVIKILTPSA